MKKKINKNQNKKQTNEYPEVMKELVEVVVVGLEVVVELLLNVSKKERVKKTTSREKSV